MKKDIIDFDRTFINHNLPDDSPEASPIKFKKAKNYKKIMRNKKILRRLPKNSIR